MMNKFKKIFIGTLVLLLISGCGAPKLKDGKEVLFEMNGGNMTADELYEDLKMNYGFSFMLKEIDIKLLNQQYKTTNELKKQVESEILAAKNQLGSDFADAIQYYYGVTTEKELYDLLEMNLKKKMAINDYALSIVKDEEIKKYYDEKSIGDITAYHMLIIPDTSNIKDDMSDEEKTKLTKEAEEAALKKTKELIEQLNSAENKLETFKELAKKNSEDGTASKGGELNPFNRGTMVEPFEDAAIKLKVGEYTKEPVKTQFGYHIIYKEKQAEKGKLEDLKSSIKTAVADDKVKNTTNIEAFAMESLREKYKLEIFDPELKIRYDNYLNEQKGTK
jgi:parvulin-like peptidyl-prolyl isomerase